MNGAAWSRLEELLDQVVELGPLERSELLDRMCADDDELRAEIESLLSVEKDATEFFESLGAAVFPGRTRSDSPVAGVFPVHTRSDSPVESEPAAGDVISHYEILERLGGGMGVVYRARDRRLDRTVVLKLLPSHLGADPEARSRLFREARAVSALNHAHLCTLHEIGETAEGQLYLVMPFYRGKTLKAKIVRGPLPLDEAVTLAEQLAEGLSAAHEEGIVHRDIKPANILVSPGVGEGMPGGVKLLDFGIAKVPWDDLTRTGVTLGTVAYMSPEQVRGEPVDGRTDLWSLGVVLYEMLTAVKPFGGDRPEVMLHAILGSDPKPLRSLRLDVPEHLEKIVQRLLRKDANERYQSALELWTELRELRKMDASPSPRRGLQARRSDGALIRRLGPRARPPGTAPIPSVGPQARRRLPFLIAAAGLVVLACGLGLFLLRGGPQANLAGALPAETRSTLLILPFENVGPPDLAYFAAGMTEEITSRLASVNALGVISGRSARLYGGEAKTLRQLGTELSVEFVLEGTVRWAGAARDSARVRITSYLSRSSDEMTVWSHTYEREMADVFEIQAEIAEAVVEQLGLRIDGRRQPDDRPTESLEAYHAYLRGQYYTRRRLDLYSADNWLRAIAHLEHAVTLDPAFYQAYAALTWAHSVMVNHGYDPSDERRRMARAALDRAIRLAPEAPEVWLARGDYHYFVNLEYGEALSAYDRAAGGMPAGRELLTNRAFVLRRQARWDEAVESFEQALRVEPRDARALQNLAEAYFFVRRFPEALELLEMVISLVPDEHTAHRLMAHVYWNGTGDLASARTVLESIPGTLSALPDVRAAWYYQELLEGNYAEALRHLAAVDTVWPGLLAPPKPLLEAFAYDLMGDSVRAREAYDETRKLIERELKGHPKDEFRYPRLRSVLGLAYAGLGRRVEAIREGEAAVAHRPLSKDALIAPQRIGDLALIYTMVGEYEAAMDQIVTLLAIPSWAAVPLLRLDPRWAPLRDRPRFRDLAAEAPR